MQSILDALFYTELEERKYFQHLTANAQEVSAYDVFYEQLTAKQKEDYLQFEELWIARNACFQKEIFKRGFKLGIQSILELFPEISTLSNNSKT